jgi:hypothetical protein
MAATEIGRNFRIRSCSSCTYGSTQRLTSTATIVQANNGKKAPKTLPAIGSTLSFPSVVHHGALTPTRSSHAHRWVVRPSHRCQPGYPQCIAILRTTTQAVHRRRVERSAWLLATAAAQVLKEMVPLLALLPARESTSAAPRDSWRNRQHINCRARALELAPLGRCRAAAGSERSLRWKRSASPAALGPAPAAVRAAERRPCPAARRTCGTARHWYSEYSHGHGKELM